MTPRDPTSGPSRTAGAGPDHEVVIIGAGLSGLGVAIELRRAGIEDVVILERAARIGGTWRDNTYPGIGVDVPAQGYQFTYRLNPRWSRVYATGAEVMRYIDDLADRYDLRRLVRFDAEVVERRWDEDAHLWRLRLAEGPEVTARFVVSAIGPFPVARPPGVPGVEDFAGPVLRSASWDHSVPLDGRRAAIVGTGASAVQIIPEIARRVARLDVYQRTAIWVAPKINPKTPRGAVWLFARVPPVQRVVRDAFAVGTEMMLINAVIRYDRLAPVARGLTWLLRHGWYRRQVPDPELRARLTPDYDFGCKRPAVSNRYLSTFTRDNVDLVTDPIERVTRNGIRTRDGVERAVDVLVLATGFRLAFDPEIYRTTPVRGRDGFDLASFYQDHLPWNYESISIPGLPNHFMVFGHYGWTGGTWHELVESASIHIARVIAEARRRRATAVEVRSEAADRWTDFARRRYRTSLFTLGSCATANSYYFDHHGESAYVRPTSARRARHAARTFPLDDYAFARNPTPPREIPISTAT